MGSMFGNIMRGVGGAVATTVRTASRSPVAKMVPGLSAISLGLTAMDMLSGGNKGVGSMPGLPGMPGGMNMLSPNANAGKRGWFSNDPDVSDEVLKAAAISKGNLKQYYRAPHGYVVMRDENGDPMGVPRYMARKLGWKPAKKPLLSIRDTNAIRQAGRAIKKLQGAEKMAKKIANWKTPHKSIQPKYEVLQAPPKLQIARKSA